MGFDPYNGSLKIQESLKTPTPKVGAHSFTLPCTPGSMKCDCHISLLARTFARACLGHEPKVRVATL